MLWVFFFFFFFLGGGGGVEDVPLVEFMYLVRVTTGGSGLCCLRLCDVFRALINSPVC